jgi:hypothetical protein
MGICVGRMAGWILRRSGIVISMFQTVRQLLLTTYEDRKWRGGLTLTASRPNWRFLRACSFEAAIRLVDALAIVICTRYNIQGRKEVEVTSFEPSDSSRP